MTSSCTKIVSLDKVYWKCTYTEGGFHNGQISAQYYLALYTDKNVLSGYIIILKDTLQHSCSIRNNEKKRVKVKTNTRFGPVIQIVFLLKFV